MTFSITKLVGDRAIVKGTDKFGTEGSTVVTTTQWDEVQAHSQFHTSVEAYDAAVEEFFAPLIAATEAVEAKMARPAADPISHVVLHEGTEAVQGEEATIIKLGRDAIILRIVEEGKTDRLVWVDDELEILAVEVEDDVMAVADAAGVTSDLSTEIPGLTD